MLALSSDKKFYVMHFMFDVIFLGFYVIWGRVLMPLLQVWKMHQLGILRPRGDLDGHEIHMVGILDESAVVHLATTTQPLGQPSHKLHNIYTLYYTCPLLIY